MNNVKLTKSEMIFNSYPLPLCPNCEDEWGFYHGMPCKDCLTKVEKARARAEGTG